MVEQAVQTGPVDSMNSQKLPPVKVTPGIPRSARQVPQANSKVSGMYTPLQPWLLGWSSLPRCTATLSWLGIVLVLL